MPEDGNGQLSMRVGRQTLRERAADVLRQAIIDHRLPPGTHLKERELCDRLGVSRTSVREALRHLESEQLIETIPHRGPVVVSLSAEDAHDLYRVRAALEGLAGELFATSASDEQISRLAEIGGRIATAARQAAPEPILAEIEAFFGVLYEGSGSRTAAELVRRLNTRISIFRRLALADGERRRAMLRDVESIVAAAQARDAEALRQACIDHVQAASAAVMNQLGRTTAGPTDCNQGGNT